MMINVSFPDGQVRQYEAGTTAMDIASSISKGLAQKVLSAQINEETWDASRPILADCTIKLNTWEDAAGKSTFWHSTAHLMAEALESLYPGTKFGIGPPIETGFYYDVDLGDVNITEEDLLAIEKKMNELVKLNSAYQRKEVSKAEAIAFFTEKNEWAIKWVKFMPVDSNEYYSFVLPATIALMFGFHYKTKYDYVLSNTSKYFDIMFVKIFL